MRKKSLFDLAMEKKRTNLLVENSTNNKSKLLINSLIIIKTVFTFLIYIVISILLTIGATVLINKDFRCQFFEIIRLNF
ncbi:MAG: hypothetical protein Q4G09_07945 [Clostridia bacterium]|nr:hypothetical protein [Clostridia bacterium]